MQTLIASAASKNLVDRSRHLLRILVMNGFYGSVLPPLATLVQTLRLPKSMVQEALDTLVTENLIQRNEATYHRVYAEKTTILSKVGLVTQSHILSNAYGVYQDFLIGLAETLNANSYEVLLQHDLATLESKLVAVGELQRSGVKAMVLLGQAEPELRHQLRDQKMPTVICGNMTFDQSDFGCVCSDNFGGMRDLVKSIIALGHRDIAYYTVAANSHDGFHQRLLGYRDAMAQAGLPTREDFVLTERHDVSSARWTAEAYVKQSRRPSVIVCGSDREAFELIAELHRSGIEVPNDVGVSGFDNSLYDAMAEHGLSSVEIHARTMGRIAGSYLLAEIQGAQFPVRMVVPTQLILRNSVRVKK